MNGSASITGSARLYWLHTLTPLHVGSGRGVEFIDLPIMREKTTGWPLVPGSSVKGVWRARTEAQRVSEAIIGDAFGRATDQDDGQGGSLAVTDAHIVLLPVRSLYGTFAYCTSRLVLTRLMRDMNVIGGTRTRLPVPNQPSENEALVTQNSVLAGNSKVFVEDLDLEARPTAGLDEWARWLGGCLFPDGRDRSFRDIVSQRLIVLPDNTFTFLSHQGTEVNARVRIDPESKTVADKALWYEESLPTDTVLAGLVWCERLPGNRKAPDELLDLLCSETFTCQIGGKATTGKGLVRCLFTGREN